MASSSVNGEASRPFRIAIVGGGLGGLVTAICLNHYVQSHAVTISVYEQASAYREIGAGIGLGPNAARIFRSVGIATDVERIAGIRKGIWISFRRYDDGSEIYTVPLPTDSTERNLPCSRSELLDVLVETIKTRKAATLHTNKQCISVTETTPDELTLHFADQTTTTANLVIAADGIHSALRAQFTSDEPVYGGMIAYRATIPISVLPSPWPFPEYNVLWCAKRRHFLVFPISANKTLNIVAFATKDESEVEDTRESWTQRCTRDEVERDFAGFEPIVQHIIRSMPDPSSKWRLNYREPLDQWVWMKGKLVILGDAAHSMMPHQGAGAGQAVEDAYVLAKCLEDYLGGKTRAEGQGRNDEVELQKWMQYYQDVRLPRAQKVAVTSKQAGEMYEMVSPELEGKDFEECLPLVAERLKVQMQWVWMEDVSSAYNKVRAQMV